MVSYVYLLNFLNDPEKELKESIKNQGQASLFLHRGLLFSLDWKSAYISSIQTILLVLDFSLTLVIS